VYSVKRIVEPCMLICNIDCTIFNGHLMLKLTHPSVVENIVPPQLGFLFYAIKMLLVVVVLSLSVGPCVLPYGYSLKKC